MNVGERIRDRRKELEMSVDDLALILGKDRSTIYRYESNDIEKLPTTILEPLAKALRTTPAYLMGWSNNSEDVDLENYGLKPIKFKKFPIIGNIACGKPAYADQEYETFIEASADIKADFCLIAKGDSMINARIFDGDVVFVRSQPAVDNGEIAAVIINDEATLKRVYVYPGRVELRPENPTYPVLNYEGSELENIKILGKAVAFQSYVR